MSGYNVRNVALNEKRWERWEMAGGQNARSMIRLADEAFPHVALRRYDLDGLRARWLTQTRQRISVALARGNSAILASWRLRSWPAGQ